MKSMLLNVGFGNMVAVGRLIAIASPDSSPIKRIIQDARERTAVIAATHGRRTRAVVVMDSGHIVLCALQTETLANRLNANSIEELSTQA